MLLKTSVTLGVAHDRGSRFATRLSQVPTALLGVPAQATSQHACTDSKPSPPSSYSSFQLHGDSHVLPLAGVEL